jgi:hypothetical protein
VRENAYHLLEDMLSLANHPYYNWTLTLDLENVYHKYHPQVFLDFFNLFYEENRIREDGLRFACKENDLFDFAFQLWRYYGQAKFLYLCRDPRDYAASFMNVPAGFKTAYNAAMNWKREQEKCELLATVFDLPVHRIKYEDLLTDTSGVMEKVLDFLEEPIEESCFEVQAEGIETVARNVYWKNLNKPIIKTNFGKYRTQFDTATVNVIETIVREQMLRFGYDFDTKADWQMPRFFRYRNALANRLNRSKMRAAHAETCQVLSSRNDLIRAITRKRKDEWLRRQAQTQ